MTKKPLPRIDMSHVISRLGACRLAMIELRKGSAPRSMRRASADQMISNIDELAWILTGERDHFHDKGHGQHLSRGPR